MNRAIGTVAALLVLILVLPGIARVTQGAVPALLALLLLLAIVRLGLAPRRR